MPDTPYDLGPPREPDLTVHPPGHPGVLADYGSATLHVRDGDPYLPDDLVVSPEVREAVAAARARLESLYRSTWDEFVGLTRGPDGGARIAALAVSLGERSVLPKGEEHGDELRVAETTARFRLGVLRLVLDRLATDGEVPTWDEAGDVRARVWPTLRAPDTGPLHVYLRAAERLYHELDLGTEQARIGRLPLTTGGLFRRIHERAGAVDPRYELEPAGDGNHAGEAVRSAFRRASERYGAALATGTPEEVIREAHRLYHRLFTGG